MTSMTNMPRTYDIKIVVYIYANLIKPSFSCLSYSQIRLCKRMFIAQNDPTKTE